MSRPLVRSHRSRNLPAQTAESSDPFLQLQQEMNRMFDDVFSGFGSRAGRGLMGWAPDGALSPQVDLKETDDALEASVDLPGVEEKDLDVEISDNVLTLRGEKRFEREEGKRDGEGYHFVERSYGSFARAILLPVEVDEDRVEATFNNGVLRLRLPKRPEALKRSRKIAISANRSNGETLQSRA